LHPISETDVKELAKYEIDIYGLQHKQYVYDFESGDAFFEELEQELVSKGHFKTHLVLTKSATMIILDFEISGIVGLTCDRSLEPFDEAFEVKEKLILKFGDKDEIYSDEMEVIRFDTTRINIARHIFDYIVLGLPMKRLHPRFRDDNANEEIFVYSSSEKKQEEEEPIDPRWAKLKQLK
jgi:uncharacterized metal-binding protein YceD (DUF177 family)